MDAASQLPGRAEPTLESFQQKDCVCLCMIVQTLMTLAVTTLPVVQQAGFCSSYEISMRWISSKFCYGSYIILPLAPPRG